MADPQMEHSKWPPPDKMKIKLIDQTTKAWFLMEKLRYQPETNKFKMKVKDKILQDLMGQYLQGYMRSPKSSSSLRSKLRRLKFLMSSKIALSSQ